VGGKRTIYSFVRRGEFYECGKVESLGGRKPSFSEEDEMPLLWRGGPNRPARGKGKRRSSLLEGEGKKEGGIHTLRGQKGGTFHVLRKRSEIFYSPFTGLITEEEGRSLSP